MVLLGRAQEADSEGFEGPEKQIRAFRLGWQKRLGSISTNVPMCFQLSCLPISQPDLFCYNNWGLLELPSGGLPLAEWCLEAPSNTAFWSLSPLISIAVTYAALLGLQTL